LHNATSLRTCITRGVPCVPSIETRTFDDIQKISGTDLINLISSSYDKVGVDETIVITRSNKRAKRYNQGIRNTVLFKEEELSTGDYLMVVKNNYFDLAALENIDFIANGDVAKIVRIKKYHEIYGLRFADVTLRFIDYNNVEIDRRIMIDTLASETASMTSEQMMTLATKIMEDYPAVKSKKERVKILRESPFYNALQVKFAYAVTCHKAQGGQWEHVFIDHDYLQDTTLTIDNLRWFYTAFTRASGRLYLVNFKDEFFS
jgi:exodeoxyribonuclease-5